MAFKRVSFGVGKHICVGGRPRPPGINKIWGAATFLSPNNRHPRAACPREDGGWESRRERNNAVIPAQAGIQASLDK